MKIVVREFSVNQAINSLFAVHQMRKNTTLNINGTNKESNWSIETESCEGTLGIQIKHLPILFKNSAVWRKVLILMKQLLILVF